MIMTKTGIRPGTSRCVKAAHPVTGTFAAFGGGIGERKWSVSGDRWGAPVLLLPPTVIAQQQTYVPTNVDGFRPSALLYERSP